MTLICTKDLFLKQYTGNTDDLLLNFTVAVEGTVSRPFTHIYNLIPNRLEFGVAKTLDLIPNESKVAVTKENRLQYIQLVSHCRLSEQIKLQSEAFFKGVVGDD